MKIKIIYPKVSRHRTDRRDVLNAARWPFIVLGFASVVVDLCTSGPSWSLVAVWSLWMLWSTFISTAMVEYNRISQVIKVFSDSCILLILINLFFGLGWMSFVVPIVCFGGLVISGILFFTDFDRQKQNLFPLLLLAIVSLAVSIAGLCIASNWPLIVMCAVSFGLIAACLVTLGRDFPRELRKRFYTK